MEDLARHLERFLSLDGEKTVGLGGDWDGCDAFPKGVTGIESLPDFRDLDVYKRQGYCRARTPNI